MVYPSERGSISERIHHMRIRKGISMPEFDILLKQEGESSQADMQNDPMAAASTQQQPMNMPIAQAGPPKSSVGMKLDEIDTHFSTGIELIAGINQDLSQASAYNIDMRVLSSMQNDLLELQRMTTMVQTLTRALKEKHDSLAQHSPQTPPMGGGMGMMGM